MKYAKLTYEFMKKNWLAVFLHVLIPTIIYTAFVDPISSFDYMMKNLSVLNASNVGVIFKSLHDASKWNRIEYVLFILGLIVITVIVFSSYIGKIQNKMRYGVSIYTGIKGVFKRTNENLFASISAVIVVVVAMEVYSIVMSLVIFLAIKVFTSEAMRIIFVVLFGALGMLGMFIGLAWISCALPNMTMRHIPIFKSMRTSMTMVSPKRKQVFAGILIPTIIAYIPLLVIGVVDVLYDNAILTACKYAVSCLFYLHSFAYYITFMYVEFFSINDIEREDLKDKIWGYTL